MFSLDRAERGTSKWDEIETGQHTCRSEAAPHVVAGGSVPQQCKSSKTARLINNALVISGDEELVRDLVTIMSI